MRRDLQLKLAGLAWLTFVWVMLWGTLSVANVLGGILVALAVVYILPLPAIPVTGKLHLLAFLKLHVVVAYQLIKSSWQLMWFSVRPGPPPRSAILKRQLTTQSDLVLTLISDALNLIPGSIVLEIDKAARVVFVHVFGIEDAEAIARFHRDTDTLERVFAAAFERDREYRPVKQHHGTIDQTARNEQGVR
jgi:multicomponent Na+:H+ antiporter subunit E